MGSYLPGFWTRCPRLSERKYWSLSPYVIKLLLINLIWILSSSTNYSVLGTECMKRKYYEITVTYLGGQLTSSGNRTITCNAYFQWTIQDFCCYDRFDRYEKSPYCCYSETYKLVLAVGFICLVLLACSFSIFFCWVYNLPHHILYLLTCGRFHLNSWMLRNKNGPYVDPSFYSAGDPFWARGPETQTYAMGPLRPMPPKIFYPAPPPKLKYRWDMANGEIPLFIIASRQFTRNPYSARPSDRSAQTGHHSSSFLGAISESRRNSLTNTTSHLSGTGSGNSTSDQGTPHPQRRETSSAPNGAPRRGSSALLSYRGSGNLGLGYGGSHNGSMPPPPPFRVNIDEMEAAAELIEALKLLDERGDSTFSEWNGRTPSETASTIQMSNMDGGTFMMSEAAATMRDNMGDRITVRPNTTGGGGCLDQYGNYVSLTNHSSIGLMGGGGNRHLKPNQEALNQQLSSLGLPVYSMPGVHTAGVVSTVQNYHVVSSNLGNPMETILEDDSIDEDLEKDDKICLKDGNSKSGGPSSSSSVANSPAHGTSRASINSRPIPLRRRATSISVTNSVVSSNSTLSRVSSAMDHVVVSTPTARANVPFNPTLPGSLPEGSSTTVDATFIDALVRQGQPAARRNSVV